MQYRGGLDSLAVLHLNGSVLRCADAIGVLAAEDYRFSPALVRRSSGRPLTLTVSNAGREVHEFASSLLAHAREISVDGNRPGKVAPTVVTLAPGRTVRFRVEAPAGTYLYWCKRKGHHNMSGTLIFE